MRHKTGGSTSKFVPTKQFTVNPARLSELSPLYDASRTALIVQNFCFCHLCSCR